MRKVLYVLAALLFASPAMAQAPNVAITCDVNDGGWITLKYTVTGGPPKLRAVALDVSVDVGAIVAIRGYTQGESVYNADPTLDNRGFGIFPGSIDLTDPENPVWGNPIAPPEDPGAAGTGIGTQRVILEMGSLYDTAIPGDAPLDTGTLCQLRMSNSTTANPAVVTIVEETTHRGGVVMEDPGVTPTVNIASPACSPVWTYTGPDTTEWTNVGSPSFWASDNQCYGDASGYDELFAGRYWVPVGMDDIPALIAGFRLLGFDGGTTGGPQNPADGPWIAADFDHADELFAGRYDVRVGMVDVGILVANFRNLDPGSDCSP